VVARTRGAAVDLLLRTLRVCEYYGTRYCDVHTVFNRHIGGRSASVSGRALVSLLFQPWRVLDALRHNSSSNLLRCRVRNPTDMVVNWFGRVVFNNHDLDGYRLRLVEGFKALVKSDLKREIVKALGELPLANMPNIRKVRREFSNRLSTLPARDVIELAIDLINDNLIQRLVAYELVLEHPSAPLSLIPET